MAQEIMVDENDLFNPEVLPERDTWFTKDNLAGLSFKTKDETIDFLQKHALTEGFGLTCSHVRVNTFNVLRCHHHKSRKKATAPHEDCPFHVTISLRTKQAKMCVVTRYELKHTHM
jgi:hypothetical protein